MPSVLARVVPRVLTRVLLAEGSLLPVLFVGLVRLLLWGFPRQLARLRSPERPPVRRALDEVAKLQVWMIRA